jgi:hypothetical protein
MRYFYLTFSFFCVIFQDSVFLLISFIEPDRYLPLLARNGWSVIEHRCVDTHKVHRQRELEQVVDSQANIYVCKPVVLVEEIVE